MWGKFGNLLVKKKVTVVSLQICDDVIKQLVYTSNETKSYYPADL